ncbi:MAG: adenine phosphoribosyltransferase [Rickettsiales bacterium]|nr:adenine phosphoribosyltransferase [Rickettsiales bacterium]
MNLTKYIRDIPDFPKKGIVFKDITPLLSNGVAYKYLIEQFYNRYKKKNIDIVVGIEARGFILGSSLATRLGCGFVPIRKKDKLPHSVHKKTYSLEYGTDTIEIHKDAIRHNNNVLIVDDVLATGGTVKAAIDLVNISSCNLIECCFMIELKFLNGLKKIKEEKVEHFSLLQF